MSPLSAVYDTPAYAILTRKLYLQGDERQGAAE